MTQFENSEKVKVYYDPSSLPLAPYSNRVTRLFVKLSTKEEPYKITVKPTGETCELNGKVDSQQTRNIVLSMVHTNHPARDIIDHLVIVPNVAA